jgi:hypothetical protein
MAGESQSAEVATARSSVIGHGHRGFHPSKRFAASIANFSRANGSAISFAATHGQSAAAGRGVRRIPKFSW